MGGSGVTAQSCMARETLGEAYKIWCLPKDATKQSLAAPLPIRDQDYFPDRADTIRGRNVRKWAIRRTQSHTSKRRHGEACRYATEDERGVLWSS